MEIYFSFFIIFTLIFSSYCIIPEWNLEKAAEKLLNSSNNEYKYIPIERNINYVYLKMTRIIKKINNTINYTNELYISNKGTKIIETEVAFDWVESFHYIDNNYIVCPRGQFHPYNANTGKYIEISGFAKKGSRDWDLKCYKHQKDDLTFLLVFYLMNGNKHLFYRREGEQSWGYIGDSFASELYDFKLEGDSY